MRKVLFRKVLIANRGEVAVRVIRTLRDLGIRSVAVASEADAGALHVRLADEAVLLGPGPVKESYLNGERILAAARDTSAEAIHPGYGFFSEHAGFARACADAGLIFIGPSPEAIETMGLKTSARRAMQAAGIPVVPGTTEPVRTAQEALAAAREVGFPIALKTVGGGGGKGFHVALSEQEIDQAFARASGEGDRFFANPDVYVERYLDDPRHVEVQILADGEGNVVHLFERDCSVQRRHQKLVEEAPAPTIDEGTRRRICALAVDVARTVGYLSAGTVEGLLVGDRFFFLEMNTRLQVEHPVTEAITGIDIVREQIRVAAGEPLSVGQDDVRGRGVAIECRINAEAAHRGFLPSPGTVGAYREPGGPGIRVDSGVREGSTVPPFYDSLLAKVVAWDLTREGATARMLRALGEFEIAGLATLVPFHRALLATAQWGNRESCRDLLADRDWLRSIESGDAATGSRGDRAAAAPFGEG